MMAAAQKTDDEDELQCAYCFGSEKEMTDPRQLPCGHVNCLECIQDDVAANTILQCPKCRKAFDHKPEELDRYKPGTGVQKKLHCDTCQEILYNTDIRPAKVYCLACPKKLCKDHEQHHEILFPKHKKVISIADFKINQRKLENRCCLKHNETLKLVCRICLTKFCDGCGDMDEKCTTGDSGSGYHRITTLKAYAAELKEKLKKNHEQALCKEVEFKDYAKECDQVITEFDEVTEALAAKIKSHMTAQIDSIRRSYEDLEGDLRKRRKDAKDSITAFVEGQVGRKLNLLSKRISMLDTAICDGHEVDIVSSYRRFRSSAEELIAEKMPSMRCSTVINLKQRALCRQIEIDLAKECEITVGSSKQVYKPNRDDQADTHLQPAAVVKPVTVRSTEFLLRCPDCEVARKRNKRGNYVKLCGNCCYNYGQ